MNCKKIQLNKSEEDNIPEISAQEGIVVRAFACGDADTIIKVLSPTAGKFSIFVAKNRKLQKGRPALDILDYGNFELKQGKGSLIALKAFHPQTSFHHLRENFEKLLLSSFLAEVFDVMTFEDDQDSGKAFELFLDSLKQINLANNLKQSFRITYDTLTLLMLHHGIIAIVPPASSQTLLKLAKQIEHYAEHPLASLPSLPLAIEQLKKECRQNK